MTKNSARVGAEGRVGESDSEKPRTIGSYTRHHRSSTLRLWFGVSNWPSDLVVPTQTTSCNSCAGHALRTPVSRQCPAQVDAPCFRLVIFLMHVLPSNTNRCHEFVSKSLSVVMKIGFTKQLRALA